MARDKYTKFDEDGRVCRSCHIYKPWEDYHKHSGCVNGYNTVCKECRKGVAREHWKSETPVGKIYNRAKSRANKKGIEFNIELSDIVIPDVCPVLKLKEFTPSIDRIDPSKGYIKGNIRIISNRANMLKNNASVEELELILEDLRGLTM